MADIAHMHIYSIELNDGVIERPGGVLFGLGDDAADAFKLTLKRGGDNVSDLESATGYFIRPDGTTVIIPGTVNGNQLTLVLPEECYEYTGEVKLTVKAETTVGDGADVTVLIVRGRVLITRTNRVADPGSTWNLDDLWAALNDKVDEPASEGTSGQALMTDGSGNRYWGDAPSSGATGSVIVDNVTYQLRTGSTGAAGYLTFVPES